MKAAMCIIVCGLILCLANGAPQEQQQLQHRAVTKVWTALPVVTRRRLMQGKLYPSLIHLSTNLANACWYRRTMQFTVLLLSIIAESIVNI
jgi:hypothetical protein